MVKLLGLEPGKESELKFKDNAAIPAWAKGAVAAAVKEASSRATRSLTGA